MFFQVWPLGSAHEATYLRSREKGETEREREREDEKDYTGVHHFFYNRHWVRTRGLAVNISIRAAWANVVGFYTLSRQTFHQRLAMPYQALAWRSDTAKHHRFCSFILFCTVHHHKHGTGNATSCTKFIRTFITKDEQFFWRITLIVHSVMTSFYCLNQGHISITTLQLCRIQQATKFGKQHCQYVPRSDQWN